MSFDLGAVTLNSVLDLKGIEAGLKEAEKMAAGYSLKVGTALGKDIGTKQKITPQVDLSELKALNTELSLKQRHLRQVRQEFARSPIKPRVDLSELKELNRVLGQVKAASNRTIRIAVSGSAKDSNQDIAGAVERGVERALSKFPDRIAKAIEDKLGKGPGSALGGAISAPLRAVGAVGSSLLQGVTFGVGSELASDFGKGLNQAIQQASGGVIGNSELLGKKMGSALAEAIGRQLPQELKQELTQRLQGVLDEQEVLIASRAARSAARLRQQQQTRAAREELTRERRETLRGAYGAQGELQAVGSRIAAVQAAQSRGEGVQARLQQIDASGLSQQQAQELARSLTEVGRELERLADEEVELLRQQEKIVQSAKQAKAATQKAKERLQSVSPADIPKAYAEALQDAIGSIPAEDLIPKIVVDEAKLRQVGAQAQYGQESNIIRVTQEFYEALYKGLLSPQQLASLRHEVEHAVDVGFGTFKGQQAYRQGQLRGFTPSEAEIRSVAPLIAQYSPEERAEELKAEVMGQRFASQAQAKQLQQQALAALEDIAGFGGVQFQQAASSKLEDAQKRIDTLRRFAQEQNTDFAETLEALSQAKAELNERLSQTSQGLIRSATGQTSADELQKLQKQIGDRIAEIRTLEEQIDEAKAGLVAQVKRENSIGGRLAPVAQAAGQGVLGLASKGAEVLGDALVHTANQVILPGGKSLAIALATTTRTSYRLAEAMESLALDFVPGGRMIKGVGKNMVLPAAGFTAATHFIPGGQAVAGLLTDAAAGAMSPLIGGAGSAMTSMATEAITAAIPNVFGAKALAGLLTGTASNAIGAVTSYLPGAIAGLGVPVLGGRALGMAATKPFQAMLPPQQPLALPFSAKETEKVAQDIGQAAQNMGELTRKATDFVKVLASTRPLGTTTAADPIKSAQAAAAALPAARELLPPAGPDPEEIKASFKAVQREFQGAYRSFQEAVKQKNYKLAQAYAESIYETTNRARTEIDKAIEQLRASGQEVSTNSELGRALFGIKSTLTKTEKGLSRGLSRLPAPALEPGESLEEERERLDLERLRGDRGLDEESQKALVALNDLLKKIEDSADQTDAALRQMQRNVAQDANKAHDALMGQMRRIEEGQPPVNRLGGAFSRLGSVLDDVLTSALALVGVFTLGDILVTAGRAAFGTAVEFERLDVAMDFATAGEGAETMARLSDEADRLGLRLRESAKGYQQFAGSVLGTNLEGQAEEIFQGFQEGAAVRSLSPEQFESVTRAIGQMANKNRVSLEELTGQLGDSGLTGALNTAAKAMGLTTAELISMVENGNVVAEDLLPKMSARLGAEAQAGLAAAAENAQAKLNRFNNALVEAQLAMGGFTLDAVKPAIDAATAGLKLFVANIELVVAGVRLLSIFLGVQLLGALGRLAGAWLINKAGMMATHVAVMLLRGSFVGLRVAALAAMRALIIPAAITTAIEIFFAQANAGSQELRDINKQVKATVDNIGEAYRKARGEAKEFNNEASRTPRKEPESSNPMLRFLDQYLVKPGRALDQAIIFGRKSPIRTFGQREETKNLEEIQQTIKNAQTGLAQQGDLLGDTSGLASALQSLTDIDLRINSIQAKRNVLRLEGDTEAIAALDQELQTLQKERQNLLEKALGSPEDLEALKKQLEGAKEELKALVSAGQVTEAAAAPELKALDEQLKEVNRQLQLADEFNKQLAASTSNLKNALSGITASFENYGDAADRALSAAKTQILQQQVAAGGAGENSARRATLQVEQQFYQQRLGQLQQFVQQYQGLIDGINEADRTTIETYLGTSINQAGPGDIARVRELYQENLTANQESILNAREQVLNLTKEIDATTSQIAQGALDLTEQARQVQESARQLREQGLNLAREYQNFLRGIARQTAETSLEIKSLTSRIRTNDMKTTLLRAITNGSQGIFKGFTDLMVESIDQMQQQAERQIELQRQRMQAQQQAFDTQLQQQGFGQQQTDLQRQQSEFNRANQGGFYGNLNIGGAGGGLTSGAGSSVVQLALGREGTDFRKGVAAQCAEFVRDVFKQAGIELGVSKQPIDRLSTGPALANSFFGSDVGQLIKNKKALQPGDLVAFGGTYGGYSKDTITHVGIYVGNGEMVDRPTAMGTVQRRSIDTFPHFVGGVRPNALAGAAAAMGVGGGTDAVTALRRAIVGQESGGNFRAVNPHSGALGYGQLMPENVGPWTREALGRSLSQSEFLNSPQLQIKTIDFKLNQMLQRARQAAGGNEEVAIRRVASEWYSGRQDLYNDTRPQSYGGGSYPSIAEYTSSVYSKYRQEAGGAGGAMLPTIDPTKEAYDQAMAIGYNASRKKDYQSAIVNFQRALLLKPGDSKATQAIKNMAATLGRPAGGYLKPDQVNIANLPLNLGNQAIQTNLQTQLQSIGLQGQVAGQERTQNALQFRQSVSDAIRAKNDEIKQLKLDLRGLGEQQSDLLGQFQKESIANAIAQQAEDARRNLRGLQEQLESTSIRIQDNIRGAEQFVKTAPGIIAQQRAAGQTELAKENQRLLDNAKSSLPQLQALLTETRQKHANLRAEMEKRVRFVLIEGLKEALLDLKDARTEIQRSTEDAALQFEQLQALTGFKSPQLQEREIRAGIEGQFRGFERSRQDRQRQLEREIEAEGNELKASAAQYQQALDRGDQEVIGYWLAQVEQRQQKLGDLRQELNGIIIDLDRLPQVAERAEAFAVQQAQQQQGFDRRDYLLGLDQQLLDAQGNAPFADPYAIARERGVLETGLENLRFDRARVELEQMITELGLVPAEAEKARAALQRINQVNLQNINAQANLLKQQLADGLAPVFETFFQDLILGGKSVQEMFQGLLSSVASLVAQLAAQALTRSLLGGLFGGGGGLFGGLFAEGGTVSNFAQGGEVQNYASGGIAGPAALGVAIMAAMRREGPQAVPIVASVGEEVLSTRKGDAQLYRSLKANGHWQRLKQARFEIDTFAEGGSVQAQEFYSIQQARPTNTAQSGSNLSITVPVTVEKGAEMNPQDAGRLGQAIRGAVQQELVNQKRPGGLLYGR